MDSNLLPSSSPRKVKFAPKGPPRREVKSREAKSQAAKEGDDGDEINEALLRKANDHLKGRPPKAEKKSSVQVAFAHGVASSTSIRKFGVRKEGTGEITNGEGWGDSTSDDGQEGDSTSDDGQDLLSLPSTDIAHGTLENSKDPSFKKKKREYKEPWDYHHSYYPITLPWRRPFSGDSELLDEEEFGKAASALEYDENTINSASDLGLMEQGGDPEMLFFQLPASIPFSERPTAADRMELPGSIKLPGHDAQARAKDKVVDGSSVLRGVVASPMAKGKEIAGQFSMVSASREGKGIAASSTSSMRESSPKKVYSLEELPAGWMGKMLVYKSGAVKLKLGDILYDVSPGSDCAFAQQMMLLNTAERQCNPLGALNKRAIVTPDIDSLLEAVIHLE